MYSSLIKHVIIPSYDLVIGNSTRKFLVELERSQWFTAHEITEIQEAKLRLLVKHAYETVPYYRRTFKELKLSPRDINDLDSLKKLPILTRNIVRQEYRALVSRDYPKSKTISGATGGSTGEPIVYHTTREDRQRSSAARFLAWRWAGFENGDKYAHVFGLNLDRPTFQSFRKRIEGIVKRQVSLDAYNMSEKTMEKFVQKIKSFQPKVIYGFSMAVANLARFIEDKGIKGIQVKSVIVDSMSLFEHEVETIERVFGCRVWWNYHNRENGTFASECSKHNGYHLFAQNHIFEFIRKGAQVKPGQTGSIVVTDLHNYAMPFIRYEVGDLGVLSHGTCSCGRGLPLMKELHGRTMEILVSATGDFIIAPLARAGHVDHVLGARDIRQYQIVQKTRTKVVVKIVPGSLFASQDTNAVRKAIRSVLGDLEVEIRLVDSIARSNSGKRQVVIRKFPIRFT